jgi:cytochrome c biogenesis protein CcmG/thiol:disulfide interchange protein DsbE
MWRYLLPLGLFIGLVVLLGVGLKLDPREVPSPLIDKPAPAFTLPRLQQPDQTVSPADFKGRVWLLNVWASWCVSCRVEHPVLNQLAKTGVVPLLGLNYKDNRQDALQWQRARGDPYTDNAFDADRRVGIDSGVYGVPETFVIDKRGMIRLKHTGPLTPKVIEDEILPLVRKLNGEPA